MQSLVIPLGISWASSSAERRENVKHLNPHAYLFTEEQIPPRSDMCDTPLSVKHLLMKRGRYRNRETVRIRGDLHQIL
jgi:hypothetical protein